MPIDRTEYQRAYRAAHKEYFKAYHRRYDSEHYQKNRDKILARKKAQRLRNPPTEEPSEEQIAHREFFIDYNQSYYQRNKERINARDRENYHKRKLEPPSPPSPPVPRDPWYEAVRLNILKGISTSTLGEEECNRWWLMHNAKIKAEYIAIYGRWKTSNEVPNAFVF